MRTIKYIVLHCTATSQETTLESILNYWKNVRGWKSPGYHYLIMPDGEIKNLIPIVNISNGVKGYNRVSINISYMGGIDSNNNPIDNRTDAQKASQLKLVKAFYAEFPNAIIKGHRDFPGVRKSCPSFEVADWLQQEKINASYL